MNIESTARELLAELERSHAIIHHALLLMTTEQKQAWAEKNNNAGLVESGTTRFHERRKVVAAARDALADAKASPGVATVAPADPTQRLARAAQAVLDHRYQMGAPTLEIHNELAAAITAAAGGVPASEGGQR